jgi:hypothetical protein
MVRGGSLQPQLWAVLGFESASRPARWSARNFTQMSMAGDFGSLHHTHKHYAHMRAGQNELLKNVAFLGWR